MILTIKKIKAVLSDAGGILFDDTPYNVLEHSYLSQFSVIPYGVFKKAFQPFKNRAQTDLDYSKMDAFREYLRKVGHGDKFAGFLSYRELFNKEHFSDPSRLVLDGVVDTLSELQTREIPFVVVTDTTRSNERVMQDFYQPAGLADLITDLVSSKDVEHKKPHPTVFQYALDRNGLKKEDVLWVAHDYDEIRGGHEFGFEVVAIHYKPEYRQQGHFDFLNERGHFIDHFREVLDLLE